jgi:hypothetical protein
MDLEVKTEAPVKDLEVKTEALVKVLEETAEALAMDQEVKGNHIPGGIGSEMKSTNPLRMVH